MVNNSYIVAFGATALAGLVFLYFIYKRKEEENEILKSRPEKTVNVLLVNNVVNQSRSSDVDDQKPVEYQVAEREATDQSSVTDEIVAEHVFMQKSSAPLKYVNQVTREDIKVESPSAFSDISEAQKSKCDSGFSTLDERNSKVNSPSITSSVEYEMSVTGTGTGMTVTETTNISGDVMKDELSSESMDLEFNENNITNGSSMEPSYQNTYSRTEVNPSEQQMSDQPNGISPMQIAETLMRLSKPGALSCLTLPDALVLNYTLSFVKGKDRARILETVAGAASFSANLPLLTSSGCLASLQEFLKKAATDRRSCTEDEKIGLLHALTNISCSDENQKILKTSIDDLFSLSEGQEESRVGLACLCVVANLSLVNHCHPEVSEYGTRLFELLEDEDTALLKQILTLLLNLCSEASTVPKLLIAQAPSEMGTFVTRAGPIGKNTDLLIKWLRILRNLYKIIREDGITVEQLTALAKGDLEGSIYEALQDERLHMKACVFLLCHNKESLGLATSAKMLYEYLETTN